MVLDAELTICKTTEVGTLQLSRGWAQSIFLRGNDFGFLRIAYDALQQLSAVRLQAVCEGILIQKSKSAARYSRLKDTNGSLTDGPAEVSILMFLSKLNFNQ